ncbi:MAG: transporter substrate-binding domain-containing protein [Bdellovibrionaceae bacterium]|nr:transporter substrate-binding domain-containing protein [Pseudobdellovibrionaceae bacterium]
MKWFILAFMTMFTFVIQAKVVQNTVASETETWKVITVDWPPYTTEGAADQGAAAKAFAEVMATVGVKIEYLFLPWTRGIKESQKKEFVGLYPVWDGNNFAGRKNSQLLFSSPIVFVHHKSKQYKWKTLNDFKGLSVGVVDGYGYPADILDFGRRGVYSLNVVGTDEQNLRMLNFKRIDVTVADLFNARYLTEIRFPELRENLVIDPKIYKKAGLYISLKNDSKYPERIAKIGMALKNLPMQARVDELLAETFPKTSQPETKNLAKPSKNP